MEGRILQSLNLKNPKAYQLASEISQFTGESLTQTVITALEMRLKETKKQPTRTAENMLAFVKRFSSGMRPRMRSEDHADLYGDDGLPK